MLFRSVSQSRYLGVTWTSRATSQDWDDIAMSSDGRIQTAVVNGGSIWTSYDYGVTWVSRAASRNWYSIAMSSDGRIQTAVVYVGNIWTSYATTVTPNPITVLGPISSTAVVFASGGNSDQWNSFNNLINTVSSNWQSTYTTVSGLSSTWGPAGLTNYLANNNVVLS